MNTNDNGESVNRTIIAVLCMMMFFVRPVCSVASTVENGPSDHDMFVQMNARNAAKSEAANFVLPGIQNEPSTENRFIFFHYRKTGGSTLRISIANEISQTYKGEMKMLVPCNEKIAGNTMLSVTKAQHYFSYRDKPMLTGSEETEIKTFKKLFKSAEMTLNMDNGKPGSKSSNATQVKKIKVIGIKHLISCRTYSFKPPGLTQELLNQVAVFAGHFRWTNIRHLKTPLQPEGPKISCLVLVREPMSRFRSCYHERLQREGFGGRDLGALNQSDLHAAIHTRFSTTSVDGMCANEISRWMAPYDGSDAVPNSGLLSEEALGITKSRLAQCVVVNIIDNCEEAELIIKHWFPWLNNVPQMCVNSGHQTSSEMKESEVVLTEEASDMLTAAHEQEQELYDFAMARVAMLAEEHQRFVATEEGQRYTAKMALKAEEAKNKPSTCVTGLLSDTGTVCCAKSCGTCGGPACGTLPGGGSNCCLGPIIKSRKRCEKHDPPCNA